MAFQGLYGRAQPFSRERVQTNARFNFGAAPPPDSYTNYMASDYRFKQQETKIKLQQQHGQNNGTAPGTAGRVPTPRLPAEIRDSSTARTPPPPVDTGFVHITVARSSALHNIMHTLETTDIEDHNKSGLVILKFYMSASAVPSLLRHLLDAGVEVKECVQPELNLVDVHLTLSSNADLPDYLHNFEVVEIREAGLDTYAVLRLPKMHVQKVLMSIVNAGFTVHRATEESPHPKLEGGAKYRIQGAETQYQATVTRKPDGTYCYDVKRPEELAREQRRARDAGEGLADGMRNKDEIEKGLQELQRGLYQRSSATYGAKGLGQGPKKGEKSHAMSQQFTKTFTVDPISRKTNLFRDQGLNTATTRSCVVENKKVGITDAPAMKVTIPQPIWAINKATGKDPQWDKTQRSIDKNKM